MTWIAMGGDPIVAHPQILVMLRRAAATAPDDPRRQRALARELFARARYREAIAAFERLLDLTGDLGADWPCLATATMRTEGAAASLDLCAQAWTDAGDPRRHQARATALCALGRIGEATAAFRRAIAADGDRGGDPDREAMRGLLRMHAGRGDGAGLLAACDALPAGLRGYGAERGHRALALSLLGRADAANALVDLDAGTMRFRLDPPAGFDDALAEAVIADQPAGSDRHDTLVNHDLRLPGSAEFAALRDFVAGCYARYVERLAGRSFMPAIPAATSLDHGAVTVRRGGRNGQHIHPEALLTGVYHARVPPVAGGDAGALVTGVCDEIAPGHRATWGERVLPAMPGTLTIFPAHYFHDVRPTGVEAKRVVIVSDLMPA